MAALVFAALAVGSIGALLLLVAYHHTRRPRLPVLPHGVDHMEAWHDIVHDLVASGVPRDVAIDTATAELGWKPGDRL